MDQENCRFGSRRFWVKAAALAGVWMGLALPASGAPKPKGTPAPAASPKTASVLHLAPDFGWIGADGKTYPGKNFRGQPVVILIASGPDAGDLRQQARRIEEQYLQFAAKKTVFVAAFTARPGRVASNVPYVIAQNAGALAGAFNRQGDGLVVVVIGPDGNVDMVSPKVEGAQRLLDVIGNTFQTQAASRPGLGS